MLEPGQDDPVDEFDTIAEAQQYIADNGGPGWRLETHSS